MSILQVKTALSVLLGLFAGLIPAYAQHTISYDYGIRTVHMYKIEAGTERRTPVTDLGAYMYDIGPAPIFQFDVEIDQLDTPSLGAGYATLKAEQYVLLESKESYTGNPDSSYQEARFSQPQWVYHSPVPLQFDCSTEESPVRCTSSSISPQFMDPDAPLTYAAPKAYHLLGYAYRFHLIPSGARTRDTNPENDTAQVTFMKR